MQKIFFFIIFFNIQLIHSDILSTFKETDFYKNKIYEITDTQKNMQILKGETPWSLTSSYQATKNMIPKENRAGTDIDLSHNVQANLSYQKNNSLALDITSSYQKNEYIKPTSYTENSTDTMSLAAKLSYSINQNGDQTTSSINQKILVMEQQINYYQQLQNLNQDYTKFYHLIIDYAFNSCKIKSLSQVSDIIQKSVEKGKKLYETNQISQKDFLNYLNLSNQYKSNIQNLKSTSQNLLIQLSFYCDKEKLRPIINNQRATCHHFDQQITKIQKDITEISQIISNVDIAYKKSIPNAINLTKIKSNLLSAKLNQINTKSDWKPFVQTQTSRSVFQDQQNYAIAAGISLGWSPGSEQTQKRSKLYRLRKKYYPLANQIAKLNFKNQIQQIRQQLSSRKITLDILLQNLKDNNQLINYFKAQSGIKRIDSINYSNTFLRKSEIISSVFDLIASHQKRINDLKILTNDMGFMK